jgi:hypothetical protein
LVRRPTVRRDELLERLKELTVDDIDQLIADNEVENKWLRGLYRAAQARLREERRQHGEGSPGAVAEEVARVG